MELYDFELFATGPMQPTHEHMHVSLDARGRLFFNKLAYDEIGRPLGVALLYDARRQAIGVLPSPIGKQETYRVKEANDRSGGRRVGAQNFCRHYGIKVSGTLAFQNPRLNNDGVMILSLHHVKPITRGRPQKE